MRNINLLTFQPSAAWLARAEAARAALKGKATHEERVAYMKANSAIWRDLRAELMAHFGGKCWFTDAPEYVAKLDVEHFRPKAEALTRKGDRREGYWWLAFNWCNYRLCGQIPNRENKKCWFPLMPLSPVAATQGDNWQLESPVFLDPRNPVDVELVAYAEDGLVHPKPGASRRERYRVKLTNELLGLSEIPLVVDERKRTWKECTLLIRDYMTSKANEKMYGRDPVIAAEQNEILTKLITLAQSNRPFASVARSCLRLSPEKWANAILVMVN
jgi:hypothetical protein